MVYELGDRLAVDRDLVPLESLGIVYGRGVRRSEGSTNLDK